MQKRRTYQQLQPEERMTIASMKQQGSSVRAMARTLGRSASTVSRELTRNTCSVVGYADPAAELPACVVAHGATIVLGSGAQNKEDRCFHHTLNLRGGVSRGS